jgi:hypothetical protein
MGTTYEMHAGTLKGMGREATCLVGIAVDNYTHESRASIQNAQHDLPQGEYVFSFRNGSIPFRREQGIWVEEV